MPEIRDVKINEIGIPPVRSIFTGLPEPVITNVSPPVTVTIGTPIVNVPGCVEYNPNGPGVDNDPNGNRVICDANVPSFNPMDYEPDGLILSGPPEPVPKIDGDPVEAPEAPTPPQNAPKPGEIPWKTNTPVECVEGEVYDDTLKVCVKEYVEEEPTERSWAQDYLPSAQEVSTTVLIAGAAATSAVFGKPLAEFLLKLIKPAVKKIIQKAKDKMGVKEVVLSVAERRQLQRDLRK